ncbi:hypothetical protein G7074_02945 [Pedobacter sp. HDW13]|uniref:hypothetical protein n=1 Tax=Pedobacter sp. HDW13 TaxID=2714940 RepID=UPI00140AD020|nr:hypothetical protein [Pedobacter sp. HDW13]QIL38326.1 hypothetical protein G7074_02945 [Pedobacter sp. HDW13]
MTKRLPSEFAINMYLEKMMILQQTDLHMVGDLNYFDEQDPCHLYFIGKRPRVTVVPDKFKHDESLLYITFKIQKQNSFEEVELKLGHKFKDKELTIESKYPFNIFDIMVDGVQNYHIKASTLIQKASTGIDTEFLDFDVLYVGQSYGVDGARTAPDRLVNHSTLQGIYAEAMINNPDYEVWLALASFRQLNLMMFDGRTKFSNEERKADKKRFKKVFNKIQNVGLNEQQVINFTEAALIKYFQPPYNKIYKDSFPNPAHKTYAECYELDINSVCIEMQTDDLVNCSFFSDTVKRAPWNMESFFLHSSADRKSMFDFI